MPILLWISLFLPVKPVFSVELYVVHLHRYYLRRTFPNQVQDNPVVKANQKIQNWFCEKELPNFHLRDDAVFLRNGVPLNTCSNTEVIPSEWGEMPFVTMLDNEHVVTGLYYKQCVARAIRTLQSFFLKSSLRAHSPLVIHIPLDSLVFEYPLYASIPGMTSQSDNQWRAWSYSQGLELVKITLEKKYFELSNMNYEFFVDNHLAGKSNLTNEEYGNAQIKFWTSSAKLIDHLSRN